MRNLQQSTTLLSAGGLKSSWGFLWSLRKQLRLSGCRLYTRPVFHGTVLLLCSNLSACNNCRISNTGNWGMLLSGWDWNRKAVSFCVPAFLKRGVLGEVKAWALSVQLSSVLLPLPELTSLLLAWQCGTCANWSGRPYASLLVISYVLWSLSSARADLQQHSSKPCAAPSTCVHWGSPLKPGPCLKDGVRLSSHRARHKVKASLCSLRSSSSPPLSLLCCESTSCLKINTSECSKI